jgi:hypothetical protein
MIVLVMLGDVPPTESAERQDPKLAGAAPSSAIAEMQPARDDEARSTLCLPPADGFDIPTPEVR